ncbi:MAG TPA: hypothetical protein VGC35_04835 [Allosphingosinicella sp.]|jgi:hypothetical protein
MMEGGTIVGGIAKLTIEAFTDALCTKPAGEDPIVVLINPESYSQSWGILYTDNEAAGSHGEKVAEREKPGCLTLALVLDGTGTVPGMPKKSVPAQIGELRRIGMTLKNRRTNYLVLSWGTLRFKCRLKSLDVNYTLFSPDGTPLRAKVDANFESAHGSAPAGAKDPAPADAGRYVAVGPGDDLGAMCAEIYGDPAMLVDVAYANGLDSFRALGAQDVLYFPPMSEMTP